MPPARRFAFTATERMVYRIHCHTAHSRPSSQPTRPSSFPQTDIFMVDIANLPYRGSTHHSHQTHLA
jgi:hypothetical protein